MNLKLVMFKANGERREYDVAHSHYTIGRSTECEMQIPLPTLSRRHCEFLEDDDGAIKVRDLGSANGTFVNEQRVQERALKPGDRLSLGPVIFTVVINGLPASINPVRTVIVETAGADSGAPAKGGSGTGIIELTGSGNAELQLDDSLAALEEGGKKKGA